MSKILGRARTNVQLGLSLAAFLTMSIRPQVATGMPAAQKGLSAYFTAMSPSPPLKKTSVDDSNFVDGICYFPAVTSVPQDNAAESMEGACQDRLFGIVGSVSVPGLVFVGAAFGKTTQLLIVPAAAVSGGAAIPVYRPQLECGLWPADGSARAGQYNCDIPPGIQLELNFIASATIAFGDMFFPKAEASGSTQEFGTPIGLFGGLEIGGVQYVKGKSKIKVAFDLSLVGGILPASATVGTAGILGVQPGLSIQF